MINPPLSILMLAAPGAISLLIPDNSELATLTEKIIVVAPIVAGTLATLVSSFAYPLTQ